MKKLILSLSVVIAALSMVACSKDKGSGNAGNSDYNNNNYYGNNSGRYGTTPNDSRCNGNGYAGYSYRHHQQGVYYGNQMRPNCIPQNAYMGGNPYYFQVNYQMYLGTCDTRFIGRGQLCPNGYSCQTSFGPIGVCMRGY